jgi:transposase
MTLLFPLTSMQAFSTCNGSGIDEAACWAHACRKFHEIYVVHASPTTTEALARIGALYAKRSEASQQISG